MKKDPTAPATKADIHMMMGEIGKLYDANERWKEEVKKDVKEHFDVVIENMHHDYKGAHKDDMENLKNRVTRLEEEVGIA